MVKANHALSNSALVDRSDSRTYISVHQIRQRFAKTNFSANKNLVKFTTKSPYICDRIVVDFYFDNYSNAYSLEMSNFLHMFNFEDSLTHQLRDSVLRVNCEIDLWGSF